MRALSEVEKATSHAKVPLCDPYTMNPILRLLPRLFRNAESRATETAVSRSRVGAQVKDCQTSLWAGWLR